MVYLAAAMAAGINMGIRHILPLYVLLTILLGGAAWSLIRCNRAWAYFVYPLLLFQPVSTARAYPAYIAYANDPAITELMLQHMFVGQPPGNYDHILDVSTPVTGSLFFVPSLDLNFNKAREDYYGHRLFVLVHRPEGRSAMDSVHWKFYRIYIQGSRTTLYDSDWGPWRLFEIVQAPGYPGG